MRGGALCRLRIGYSERGAVARQFGASSGVVKVVMSITGLQAGSGFGSVRRQ